MASSGSRRRIEIPEGLWRELDKAAAEEGLGVSSLCGLWLLTRLRQERPEWHVDDPYRYENGPRARRNDRPEPSHMQQAYADALVGHQAFIANGRGE